MVTPYFSSIRDTLVKALDQATESIDIAVAWFTNEQLFDAVASRLDNGVKVRMVLINDDINHCGGLDFQKFIDKGGRLFFGKTGYFMHNKYCIIDGNTVYTGSYNYTYFAEHSNFENIVCISGEEPAVSEYVKNYEHILSVSDEATNVEAFLKIHPFAVNTHATKQMRNRDLYQKANEFFEQNDQLRANEILKSITPPPANLSAFVIKDVLYQQWQPGCCIRQIEVNESEVILNIDFVTGRSKPSSIILFGPGLDKTWHLITSKGNIFASFITHVKLDGQLLLDALDNNTAYVLIDEKKADRVFHPMSALGRALDGSERFIKHYNIPFDFTFLSCKLSFPKGGYTNEIVDLFEGNADDINNERFWHFLRVNLLLNREAL